MVTKSDEAAFDYDYDGEFGKRKGSFGGRAHAGLAEEPCWLCSHVLREKVTGR